MCKYSDISDHDLDYLVRDIQCNNPNISACMLQRYLNQGPRQQFAQIPWISIHHTVANPRWHWHCECAHLERNVVMRCVQFTARFNIIEHLSRDVTAVNPAMVRVKQCGYRVMFSCCFT